MGVQEVLDYQITYAPVLDAFRLAVICMGFILVLWLLRVGLIRPAGIGGNTAGSLVDTHPRFTRWCFAALALAGTLAVLQCLATFGDPMVWWRPPGYFIMLTCAWRAMAYRL